MKGDYQDDMDYIEQKTFIVETHFSLKTIRAAQLSVF